MPRTSHSKLPKRLLIVGGYGIVGEQIVEIMARENGAVELWIAGRSIDKATELAQRFPGARAFLINIDDHDPLLSLTDLPDIVLGVANDAHDNLLRSSVERGIAYVDINRWTERMIASINRLKAVAVTAPVVLASAWMAGVVATVAAHATSSFTKVQAIEFDVLFALKDKAGPNSIEYADRLRIPFTVSINGKKVQKLPFTDPRSVTFHDGRTFESLRFDTPDQMTLPQTLGVPTVAGRVTYDDPKTMGFMRLMIKSGIWTLLSLPMFTGVRRKLLFNPGQGDQHEVHIDIIGSKPNQSNAHDVVTVRDPLGQTHMTAAGAVLQVERILGLHGLTPPENAVVFPESLTDTALAIERLRKMGLSLSGGSLGQA